MGPPWGVLPASVCVGQEIGRSSNTVILLDHARVYPEGVALRFMIRVVEQGRMARLHLFSELDRAHGRGQLDERFDPTGLRWGVRFSDGSSVTTQDESPWATHGDVTDADIRGPVLEGLGRPDVFMDAWSREFWVWPTPPAPSFEIGVEWIARGISETVTSFDSAELIAAGLRARRLWS